MLDEHELAEFEKQLAKYVEDNKVLLPVPTLLQVFLLYYNSWAANQLMPYAALQEALPPANVIPPPSFFLFSRIPLNE
jgi:hypothetical protein